MTAAVRSFTLEAASPFRLDLTVWALRRRAMPRPGWRSGAPAG